MSTNKQTRESSVCITHSRCTLGCSRSNQLVKPLSHHSKTVILAFNVVVFVLCWLLFFFFFFLSFFTFMHTCKRPAKTYTQSYICMNDETNAKQEKYVEDQPFLRVSKCLIVRHDFLLEFFFLHLNSYLMWCWMSIFGVIDCRQWIWFACSEQIFAGEMRQWRQRRWKLNTICICGWIRTIIWFLLRLLLLLLWLVCSTNRIAHEICK